jgi:hypothetical protein
VDLARRQDGGAVSNGEWAPLLLDATGALVVTGGGGGASGPVDVTDRVGRLVGHVTVDNASIPVTGTFWQATQPVSIAAALDVADRAARLLGHVTVDNASIAVTMATNTPDVTDRAARLLGHVTVDNASIAVTGPLTDTQLRASAVPVSLAPVPTHAVTQSGAWTADTELPAAAALADATANPTVPAAAAAGMVYNGTTWDRARGDTTVGTRVGQASSPLAVTATAAASTGVTATLPAAGAGLFHYITGIHIAQVSSTTAGAAGAPVVVTTTNLPGSLAFTRPSAVPAGDIRELVQQFASPLKSSVANTATTIVAPVQTNIVWRITVYYYTAP